MSFLLSKPYVKNFELQRDRTVFLLTEVTIFLGGDRSVLLHVFFGHKFLFPKSFFRFKTRVPVPNSFTKKHFYLKSKQTDFFTEEKIKTIFASNSTLFLSIIFNQKLKTPFYSSKVFYTFKTNRIAVALIIFCS